MQVSIPVLNDSSCINTYPEVKPEIKVCGGKYNKTTCNVIEKAKYFLKLDLILNLTLKRETAEAHLLFKVIFFSLL